MVKMIRARDASGLSYLAGGDGSRGQTSALAPEGSEIRILVETLGGRWGGEGPMYDRVIGFIFQVQLGMRGTRNPINPTNPINPINPVNCSHSRSCGMCCVPTHRQAGRGKQEKGAKALRYPKCRITQTL